MKPAADLRTLLELVRWLETHPTAEVSIELQQGDFLARIFAPCQETPRNRLPHDQRPRFAPWFAGQELSDAVRQHALDRLMTLDLETADSPNLEPETDDGSAR